MESTREEDGRNREFASRYASTAAHARSINRPWEWRSQRLGRKEKEERERGKKDSSKNRKFGENLHNLKKKKTSKYIFDLLTRDVLIIIIMKFSMK